MNKTYPKIGDVITITNVIDTPYLYNLYNKDNIIINIGDCVQSIVLFFDNSILVLNKNTLASVYYSIDANKPSIIIKERNQMNFIIDEIVLYNNSFITKVHDVFVIDNKNYYKIYFEDNIIDVSEEYLGKIDNISLNINIGDVIEYKGKVKRIWKVDDKILYDLGLINSNDIKINLSHKGFYGSYKNIDNIYHGKIENIDHLVTFEADDCSKIKEEFINAVEDHIKFCKEYNIIDSIMICENGFRGSEPFVGFASHKVRKNNLLSLITTSAESLETFYYFYITKNMNFREIIEKRKGQIERKEDYGT